MTEISHFDKNNGSSGTSAYISNSCQLSHWLCLLDDRKARFVYHHLSCISLLDIDTTCWKLYNLNLCNQFCCIPLRIMSSVWHVLFHNENFNVLHLNSLCINSGSKLYFWRLCQKIEISHTSPKRGLHFSFSTLFFECLRISFKFLFLVFWSLVNCGIAISVVFCCIAFHHSQASLAILTSQFQRCPMGEIS